MLLIATMTSKARKMFLTNFHFGFGFIAQNPFNLSLIFLTFFAKTTERKTQHYYTEILRKDCPICASIREEPCP